MKKGTRLRTNEELSFDRETAIRMSSQGYPIREIALELEKEHTKRGRPYKVSLMTVQKDIVNVIKERKLIKSKAGVNELDDIISKYEFLYNEATLASHMGDRQARKDCIKILDIISGLKGLKVEKIDISFTNASIEEIDKAIQEAHSLKED